MYHRVVKDAEGMRKLGADIAILCPAGSSIFLQGELGAGKTTFVKGFLSALGIKENVKSPTYTLVEPYKVESIDYFHFDLYRLKSPFELDDIGIRDYFNQSSVCLFEWPEKACGYLPEPDLTLEIQVQPDTAERQIKVFAGTKTGEFLIDTLKT